MKLKEKMLIDHTIQAEKKKLLVEVQNEENSKFTNYIKKSSLLLQNINELKIKNNKNNYNNVLKRRVLNTFQTLTLRKFKLKKILKMLLIQKIHSISVYTKQSISDAFQKWKGCNDIYTVHIELKTTLNQLNIMNMNIEKHKEKEKEYENIIENNQRQHDERAALLLDSLDAL